MKPEFQHVIDEYWVLCKLVLQKYVPVLMAMAKIWWDKEDYVQVERIFHQSADLCSDHDLWKLNIAHTFFMQVSLSPFKRHHLKYLICWCLQEWSEQAHNIGLRINVVSFSNQVVCKLTLFFWDLTLGKQVHWSHTILWTHCERSWR